MFIQEDMVGGGVGEYEMSARIWIGDLVWTRGVGMWVGGGGGRIWDVS